MAKSSIPTIDITPGFRSASYEIPTTGSHTGVLLSQVAAEHLGLRGNDELIVTQGGGLVQDRRVERALVQ